MNGVARLTPAELPPGIAIMARVEDGRCASGRIISHRGIRLTPAGHTYLLSTDDADAVHFAFYRTSASRIDREPYQQTGAAYLPLDFSQLRSTSIGGYGVMLVETTIRHLGLDTQVSDDGIRSLFRVVPDIAGLRAVFSEIMTRAGVPLSQRQTLSGAAALLAVPA